MRTLPVGEAFGHAVKSTTNNIGFAWHVSWPWMLAILPFNVVGNAYVILNQAGDRKAMSIQLGLVSFGLAVLAMVAFSSIAVNWHRYILFDEVPQGWARFRLDDKVWRYIGNTILIFLIFAAAELVFALGAGVLYFILRGFSLIIIVPAVIAALLAAISYGYRLAIKLPAIAVGRESSTFGEMLDLTNGNFWQLIGLGCLSFLVLIGLALALGLLSYLVAATGQQMLLFITIALQLVINWIATIFGVTMLTSLYGFFVEKREF
jgi:hypothetical protein